MCICNCQINSESFFIQQQTKDAHNDSESLLHSKVMVKRVKSGLIELVAIS